MRINEQLAHLDTLLLSTVTTQFPEPLTDAEKATVHAYIVLTHAVIEEYIEDGYLDHFDRLSAWADYPSIPEASVRMIVTFAFKFPGKGANPGGSKPLSDLVKAARGFVEGAVKGNNGIKSANLESLSKALGVDWLDMDAQLSSGIADLEALGARRGEAGHLSPFTDKAVKLTRQVYPDDVRAWVNRASAAAEAIIDYLEERLRCNSPAITSVFDRDGN